MERSLDKLKIGLVGLGAMGRPIGSRLLAAGAELYIVPHTRPAPAEALESEGALIRQAPADLSGCAVVITCVPDVPQVKEVLFGEAGLLNGTFTHMGGERPLFIDMSTIDPSSAREHHARLAEAGIEAVDAPVSGGPLRAADGTLTIMVGGTAEGYSRALAVLSVLGRNIVHVGGQGAGQAVKLVNQLMIASIMIANIEALSLGVKAGVPLQTMLDVISTSSGSNYLMQSWLPKTLFAGALEGGFAMDLLQKDLRSVLRWATEAGMPVFGGALASQIFSLAQAQGAGRLDYSAVARLYEDVTGVKLRLSEPDPPQS